MLQFRINDIGASAKHLNQHGKKVFRWRGIPYFYFPFANIGFFKRIPPFRKWAVYDEVTAGEWQACLELFKKYGVQPIVAITATWVEKDGQMIPFPEKFPEEVGVLNAATHHSSIGILELCLLSAFVQ